MTELMPLLARGPLTHQTQLGSHVSNRWCLAKCPRWTLTLCLRGRNSIPRQQRVKQTGRGGTVGRLYRECGRRRDRCTLKLKQVIECPPCVCTRLKMLCILPTECVQLLLWFWPNQHRCVFRFVCQCCGRAAKSKRDASLRFRLRYLEEVLEIWHHTSFETPFLRHTLQPPDHLPQRDKRTETENRALKGDEESLEGSGGKGAIDTWKN